MDRGYGVGPAVPQNLSGDGNGRLPAFRNEEVSRIILTRPAIEPVRSWDFFREICRAGRSLSEATL